MTASISTATAYQPGRCRLDAVPVAKSITIINAFALAGSAPATDPHFANVALLCGFEGSDGSTSFGDESSFGRALAGVGNAQIDTSDFRFGSSSALFDGTGDRISTPHASDLNLDSSDFTIELFAKFAGAGRMGLLGKYAATTAGAAWMIERNTSDALVARYYNGSSEQLAATRAIPNDSSWHHLCFEKSAGSYGVAVDGVFGAIQGGGGAPSVNAGTDALFIGARMQGGTTVSQMNGWIDEVRITIGVARYGLTSFTPPTAAFPRS